MTRWAQTAQERTIVNQHMIMRFHDRDDGPTPRIQLARAARRWASYAIHRMPTHVRLTTGRVVALNPPPRTWEGMLSRHRCETCGKAWTGNAFEDITCTCPTDEREWYSA